MLRLAASGDELRVVADQRGRPTYAGDVAALIAGMLQQRGLGATATLRHVSRRWGPVVSWHEFAEIIVEQAFARDLLPKRVAVRAITTAEYPTAARQPANSALRPSGALEQVTGVLVDWKRCLKAALDKIQAARTTVGNAPDEPMK